MIFGSYTLQILNYVLTISYIVLKEYNYIVRDYWVYYSNSLLKTLLRLHVILDNNMINLVISVVFYRVGILLCLSGIEYYYIIH